MEKKGLRKSGGRNNRGRITIRHRGGGAQRLYRELDYVYKGHKIQVGGRIERIEYDPNRTAYVGELQGYLGRKVYKLLGGNESSTLKGSSTLIGNEIKPVEISTIEVGKDVYKVSVRKGEVGKIARATGAKCKIIKKENGQVVIRLPSGKVGAISTKNTCYEGVVQGPAQERLKKAGSRRRLGERPRVRGVAMNAVDHPLGGKTKSGQAYTKWGKLAK